MKKVLAFILCICMFFGAVAAPVSAAEVTKEKQLTEDAKKLYRRCLRTAGRSSFRGYCGLMTSHQMYNLKINTWCITNDGNRQFDYYKDLEITNGGYYISSYAATDYSLEEALNAITHGGMQDAYNILVGFQKTTTEAGRRYGHAVFINGILDGTVYFVESYDTSLDRYYREGTVITCSIAEFAAYYTGWTTYEGLIWFGTAQYSDSCQQYSTNVVLQARFESTLRSQPSLIGENDCVRLRTIAPGERLYATGILVDEQEDMYYCIQENGRTGYVAVSALCPVQVNGEDLVLQQAAIPTAIEAGAAVSLEGAVAAERGYVDNLELVITDSTGTRIHSQWCDATGYSWDLGSLNGGLGQVKLEPGTYRLELYAECTQPVAVGQEIGACNARVKLTEQALQVGGGTEALPETAATEDGWVCKDGTWYCYENGAACTGWVKRCGVEYYLNENGAVTTGWAEVDGARRYFSETGAMCTGWLTLDGVTTYRLGDGTAAVGWQNVGTGLYCFAEDGSLITGGERANGDTVYVLAQDGRATVKG